MAINQTLKQLAAPNLTTQTLSITYPALARPLKLNSGFINLLPKFSGSPGEDPYRHINEFLITCSTISADGVDEDQIKLRAFPFSLQGAAKDWLYYLPPGTFTDWTALHRGFLEKFFPASRIGSIRKKICGIEQNSGETLYAYWERFNMLCASCPQHQISEQLLVQYFYEGLLPQDRGMIDAASGGALVDKTPEQARILISNMAENSQQFGTRREASVKRVDDVQIGSLEAQIANLTTMMSKLVSGGIQTPKPCGICCREGHSSEACPQLQEIEEDVVIRTQKRYDPYAPIYNEGWRDHSNLRNQDQRYSPNVHQDQRTENKTNLMFEEIMRMMTEQNNKLNLLETNVNQLQQHASTTDATLAKFQAQPSHQFSSQPLANPKENVSAIMIKKAESKQKSSSPAYVPKAPFPWSYNFATKEKASKKEASQEKEAVGTEATVTKKSEASPEIGAVVTDALVTENQASLKAVSPKSETVATEKQASLKAVSLEAAKETATDAEASLKGPETGLPPLATGKRSVSKKQNPTTPEYIPKAPFPWSYTPPKKPDANEEILEIFRKVEINIPLLDAIKQVPRYAKFLKELCTTKRKLIGNEKISFNENVSAVLQKRLPPKCGDPGMFSIPCTIGNLKFNKAMLDLGASINVMPRNIYDKLNLGALKETGLIIQLADRSTTYPDGVLEDVLVQVNELVFPADFYVLDMGDGDSHDVPLLLGRPFLKTSKAMIDVHGGNLTMEFDDEKIKFNIFDAMRYPSDVQYVYAINVMDDYVQNVYELSEHDDLDNALIKNSYDAHSPYHDFVLNDALIESIAQHVEPNFRSPTLLDATNQNFQVNDYSMQQTYEGGQIPSMGEIILDDPP